MRANLACSKITINMLNSFIEKMNERLLCEKCIRVTMSRKRKIRWKNITVEPSVDSVLD